MKQRRQATAGKYAGLSVSYIARVVGASRWITMRALATFYAMEEFAGRESEEAILGEFVCRFKICQRNSINPVVGVQNYL